ncbi:MAG: cell division protein ZapA, partial [Magnetococcales bacterium]|nr:cell division protein ZapA [Magnetococcales bacterium]
YVDEIMRSTAGQMDTPTRARDRVATMAAIQIADSYFQAKKQLENQQHKDDQRIQDLILKADRLLGE